MICDTCQTNFCGNCLFIKHEGDCDEYQINFMMSNLDYRKCQCGVIIEKNQGCSHMTCICGHEFCYICG